MSSVPPSSRSPSRAPVSLVDLVRTVFPDLEAEARAAGVSLELRLKNDSFGTIDSDPSALRTMLVSLLEGAVRRARSGGRVTVTVGAAGGAEPGRWAIEVAPGAGIDRGRAPELAAMLGGTLTLTPATPGRSSALRVTIGSLPSSPIEPLAPRAVSPTRDAVSGLRVLVAEDHPEMQMAVRRLLESAGAVMLSAFDGQEAADQARAQSFDLILMDLRMPVLGGLEATRLLRASGCRTPIVALTADTAASCRASALAAGCDAVLSKPFAIEELMTTVAAVRGGTISEANR